MKRAVHYFYATVQDGHLMSRPKYEPAQDFMNQLVLKVQRASPTFVWIQFLFAEIDCTGDLSRMRSQLLVTKRQIEEPGITVTGDLVERRELRGSFYTRMQERIKKIDELTSRQVIVMAVQGLWVGERDLIDSLPIGLCHDEIDALRPYKILDSRMLYEVVKRRMVWDLSWYFRHYTRGRMRPPSFLVTPDELPCYIHFPSGKLHDLTSISDWKERPPVPEGSEMGTVTPDAADNSEVVRVRPPALTVPLSQEEASRLSHVASRSKRGFEIIYEEGKTAFYLSGSKEDMPSYRSALEAVYGPLDCTTTHPRPDFLLQMPLLLGLSGAR